MGKQFIIGAAGAIILTGCASGPNISPEQCAAADWFSVGVEHGKVGANITEINPAIQACSEAGTPVDIDRYKEGRSEGLKTYCTPLNVLEATAQGIGDPGSCEPMTEALRASMTKANETRAAAARYQQYQAEYQKLTDQRDQINTEGQKWSQQRARATDATNPTRTQIDNYLNQLRQQLAEVNQKIAEADPVMQTEKQTYDAAVQSYNAYKASLGGGA